MKLQQFYLIQCQFLFELLNLTFESLDFLIAFGQSLFKALKYHVTFKLYCSTNPLKHDQFDRYGQVDSFMLAVPWWIFIVFLDAAEIDWQGLLLVETQVLPNIFNTTEK